MKTVKNLVWMLLAASLVSLGSCKSNEPDGPKTPEHTRIVYLEEVGPDTGAGIWLCDQSGNYVGFDYWTTSGSGSEGVTYTATGSISVRSSSASGAKDYPHASGSGNIYFGQANDGLCTFTVKDINITGAGALKLSFAAVNTNATTNRVFEVDKFIVSVSTDAGATWIPVPYVYSEVATYFRICSFDLTEKEVAAGATSLWLKFESTKTQNRIDDIMLEDTTIAE